MLQILAGFALVAASLVAQDKLITFDAVISNSHGGPIANLSIDDLQLRDNGKPYRIAILRSNQISPDSAPPAAGLYTNRPPGVERGAILILLDLLSLDQRQLPYVKGRLINALENLSTRDYLLFYMLTSQGLVAAEPMPQMAGREPDYGWTKKIDSLVDRVRGGVVNDADLPDVTERALETVAQIMTPIRGPKSVVWITDGIPRGMDGVTRANISSSPFVKGVVGAFGSKGIALYSATGFAGLTVSGGATSMAGPDLILTEIAEQIGGEAFLNRDISGAIKAALVANTRPSYTIGFYPTVWDGKPHRIQLKCRQPGSVAIAPPQYVADGSRATPESREKSAVTRLVKSSFDAVDIGLRAAAAPSPKTPGGTRLQLAIDAKNLNLWRQGDQHAGNVSTTVIYYDATGKPGVAGNVRHPFSFTEQQRAAAEKSGIGLSDDVQLPPSAVMMRVIVFDFNSNAVGSITIPITEADRSRSI